MSSTIRLPYDMWPQYNRRLRDVVAGMTDEQLAIRPSADGSPIWATVVHTAGARVYWLCDVVGEPGAETTPFANAGGIGWEDDLDHPRGAYESWSERRTRRSASSRPAWTDGPRRCWQRPSTATTTARTRCTREARSFSGSSATRPITAAACPRRSGSTGCRRSTCGARTEEGLALLGRV